MQKKYIEYQVLEQQIKQLQQQMEKIDAQMNEAASVEQSIEDISKAKTGEEVLVPVSGGVFFKATLKESTRFLVNVGSGVVVEKGVEETKGLVKAQSSEMEKYKEHMMEELAKSIAQYQELEKELKGLVEE
jgi:prefoldin alpha subunit